MSSAREWGEVKAAAALRDRVAAVLFSRLGRDLGYGDATWDGIDRAAFLADADAVIAELDLGIPCVNTGCRMRQIARKHAEASNGLEADDE